MYSYTLTLHTNNIGNLKPPVTLMAPTPDYAYKVTYLGYFINNPNGRFAADSTAEESKMPKLGIFPFDLHVYPNPFTNQLQISSNIEMGSVYIYDVMGSLVYTNALTQTSFSINTETFADGIYLLVIKAADKYYYKRIVKQH